VSFINLRVRVRPGKGSSGNKLNRFSSLYPPVGPSKLYMGLLIVSSPSINQKTRPRNLFYVIIREYCVARDPLGRDIRE